MFISQFDTGMKKEKERVRQAFELAEQGKTVVVVSSGDAAIYGMTPLIYEMKQERGSDIEVTSFPGISAFQKAASILSAPMGHDFWRHDVPFWIISVLTATHEEVAPSACHPLTTATGAASRTSARGVL